MRHDCKNKKFSDHKTSIENKRYFSIEFKKLFTIILFKIYSIPVIGKVKFIIIDQEIKMVINFNHTIIATQNNKVAADFLAEILGLPAPTPFGPFMVVTTDNGVDLDFMTTSEKIQPKHYAFLISESEFDKIFQRICSKKIPYWADHRKELPYQINNNDGGRGLYFNDPNGHFLEILTQPYGNDLLQKI